MDTPFDASGPTRETIGEMKDRLLTVIEHGEDAVPSTTYRLDGATIPTQAGFVLNECTTVEALARAFVREVSTSMSLSAGYTMERRRVLEMEKAEESNGLRIGTRLLWFAERHNIPKGDIESFINLLNDELDEMNIVTERTFVVELERRAQVVYEVTVTATSEREAAKKAVLEAEENMDDDEMEDAVLESVSFPQVRSVRR